MSAPGPEGVLAAPWVRTCPWKHALISCWSGGDTGAGVPEELFEQFL